MYTIRWLLDGLRVKDVNSCNAFGSLSVQMSVPKHPILAANGFSYDQPTNTRLDQTAYSKPAKVHTNVALHLQPATQMPPPFTSPLPHHKSWNQAFATWNHDASIWTFAAKWLQSTCPKTGPSQPQSTETGTPRFWSPKFLLSLGIWRSWRLVQNFLKY